MSQGQSEEVRLAVKNERSRVVHLLLAFHSAAIAGSAPTEVMALWSFAFQDVLEIDGCGDSEEVAQRYIDALQDLDIEGGKISAIQAKLLAMLSIAGDSLKWSAVSVSGDGSSSTTIRSATPAERETVVPDGLRSDPDPIKFN